MENKELDSPDSSKQRNLVGIVRHADTHTFVVFITLDGNDIRQIASHRDEGDARRVYAEAQERIVQTYTSGKRPEGTWDAEAATEDWSRQLRVWQEASDAPFTPFPEGQIAQIGEHIVAARAANLRQHPLPEGTVRITEFAPGQSPRATIRPISRPRKTRRRRHER